MERSLTFPFHITNQHHLWESAFISMFNDERIPLTCYFSLSLPLSNTCTYLVSVNLLSTEVLAAMWRVCNLKELFW